MTQMRSLSDFEKSILTFMVSDKYMEEPTDRCVVTLIDKFCQTYFIEWDEEFSSLTVAHSSSEDWLRVRNRIFDLLVLLDYLEINKYIGIFPAKIYESNQIFDRNKYSVKGRGHEISIYKKGIKLDIKTSNQQLNNILSKDWKRVIKPGVYIERTGIGEILQRYANSTFHPTQALKDYVSNGFKTCEQLNFEKTYRLNWISISVAIVIGFVSLLIGIVNMNLGNKEIIPNKVIIDTNSDVCTTTKILSIKSMKDSSNTLQYGKSLIIENK